MKFLVFWLSVVFAFGSVSAADASVYDARLFSQVPVRDWIAGDRDRYLADVRAAGVDCVLASFGDMYAFGAQRAAFFDSLAQEIRFFERAGVPVMVWTDTLGYGDVRTGTADGKARFGGAQPLLGLEGGSNGAVCPLDPKMRAYACETMSDIAKAGARFILVDDDFVQSARGRLGCACPRHLARVSAKLGRAVTREEVLASFAGAPNPVRSAFVDVTGEVAMEFAGQMRAAVDVVNPGIVMGLCLSYSHWDVEGAEMDDLLGVLAGPGRRKIVRISGAPYWSDGRFHHAGLEGIVEFVRMQAEWTRGTGWKVFDENDPYPRKIAQVPTWRCELYDKATLADGLMARHKYMLCYGPKRTEPGYLEAHLANRSEDARLREIFANTEPAGVYVPNPRRRIREETLPVPRRCEAELAGLASFPMAATVLVHCGIPVRHDPSPKSYTLDRAQLGVDLWSVDFATFPREQVRDNVLLAAERAGHPVPVYAETKSRRVYLLLRYDACKCRHVALLENFGEDAADVRLVTRDKARSVEVKALAPHSWRVVVL